MTWTRRLLAVFLVLALGFGVAACGSDSDSDGGDSANVAKVESGTWTLMNIASGGSATSLPSNVKAPTLEFADGKVNVFDGCNSGSGDAEIGDTTIDFGPIGLTKKACTGVANQVAQYVALVLKGEVKYTMPQGNLSLEKGQISLILTQD